ncbi:ArnT family glycosyltransferase [Methylobacterium flocculans]|uniref:ArnT family glycosyltransferase n=1 Tax=Methylobacterium flocculans TaxID=2984843 RepID=UPI0021F36547|nr:glycosyltransferase family 39 protein [Methylobacterium sp. FF17]
MTDRAFVPHPARGDALAFPDAILAAATRSHARACVLLVVLCLVCFLPGIASLQPMDRDEPRFAQASKQMLETGDLIDIRFQAEARHKKPVGIYWAQAAVVGAAEALGVPNARTTIGLYRIPSLLGAIGAVLLTYWSALSFLPRRGALLAAALFGACVVLSAEARLAKTDALLCACAVATFGALARAWLQRERERLDTATVLAFWLGLALGILIKGPMVPLFCGLPALVLSVRARSGRWLGALRPGLGLPLTLLIVAPWFAAITWKSGGAFYGEAVGHDMLSKVQGGSEKHFAPPGAYLIAFFGTFWPGAAFAALSAPFAWGFRREPAIAFLVAWIVPTWILFEIVPTKLPHYVLPLMPAIAILTLRALAAGALHPERRGARLTAGLVVLIPVALTLGLSAFAWAYDRTLPLAGLPLLLAASAVAVSSWRAFSRGLAERALALGIVAAMLLSPAVFGLTQPVIAALKVSPRLAAIRDRLPCPQPRVASLGYREPSFVFLIGTDLAMLGTGAEAADFLKGQGAPTGEGCRLVYVEGRFAKSFAEAATAAGLAPHRVGTVSGFNINGGRAVDLSAYAVTP